MAIQSLKTADSTPQDSGILSPPSSDCLKSKPPFRGDGSESAEYKLRPSPFYDKYDLERLSDFANEGGPPPLEQFEIW